MIAALERRPPPEALSWRRVAGGLYRWARLGCGFDADDVAQAALADGVALVAGNTFYPDGDGRRDIRLCFARTPPDRIDAGIARLAHAVRRIRDTQRPASGRCPLV
jgi:DNA-binding transcriptional MocR family regulator